MESPNKGAQNGMSLHLTIFTQSQATTEAYSERAEINLIQCHIIYIVNVLYGPSVTDSTGADPVFATGVTVGPHLS